VKPIEAHEFCNLHIHLHYSYIVNMQTKLQVSPGTLAISGFLYEFKQGPLIPIGRYFVYSMRHEGGGINKDEWNLVEAFDGNSDVPIRRC
jgi:hypothetical protein